MPARKRKQINSLDQCRWPNCQDFATTKSDFDVPYCRWHFESVLKNRKYIRELYEMKQDYLPPE